MNRRHEIQMKLLQFLDGIILGLVFCLAHTIRYEVGFWSDQIEVIPEFGRFFWLLAVILPVSPIVLEFQGFYNHPLRKKPGEALKQVTLSLIWLALIFGLCVIFLKWNPESRSVMLLFLGMGGVALLMRDFLTRSYALKRAKEGGRERVVLAGATADMDAILTQMPREQRLQIEVVGRVDLREQSPEMLAELFHQKAVERVLFAADHIHFRTIERAIHVCETEGVEAWLAADFMHPTISRLSVEHFGASPMLVFRTAPDNGWAMFLKEVFDRTVAALLLIATLPVMLFAVIGIRIASPNGPVLFRQVRSGRYGEEFLMYKFRSMDSDAEQQRDKLQDRNELDGPAFKLKADPRVFKFGALLRKTSVDELPQLWNVLKGDMSLVGPRPLPVYEIKRIENNAQRRRLSVKPGLTCLWQVNGRSKITNFEDWVRLDLEYIDNWSLWLDWKILAKTIPVVLGGVGAK